MNNLFNKAKTAIIEQSGKLGESLNEVKEKALPMSEEVMGIVKDNSKAAAGIVGAKSKGAFQFVQEKVKKKSNESEEEHVKEESKNLDDVLRQAIDEYNAVYTLMNDKGTRLFIQRERSIDLIKNVENLINSIANHPKEFDAEIAEIVVLREEFTNTCEFAKKELEAAQKSAMSAGAGIAGGMAVVSLAPSAAMWIATTFGTASTGTAISALSGAAAQSAALAWLGGGALTAGGGGMAAGNALLALSGPVGWSIAGATLLASIALFANKKIKLDKQKNEEINAVLSNIEKLKVVDAKLKSLLDKTTSIRESLNQKYNECLCMFGQDFISIPEENKMQLGTLVNQTKSVAVLLKEGV